MSEENKPREFWIKQDPYPGDGDMVFTELTKDFIHVIEYSAYQALEARHAKLLELLNEQINIQEINKLNNLKKALTELIESDPNFLKDLIGE